MKTLTVALPGREYDIFIERGILGKAGEAIRGVLPKAGRLAVVTDTNVEPIYAGALLDSQNLPTSDYMVPMLVQEIMQQVLLEQVQQKMVCVLFLLVLLEQYLYLAISLQWMMQMHYICLLMQTENII